MEKFKRLTIFKRFTAIVLAVTMVFTVFCSSSYAADTQTGSTDYMESVIDLVKDYYNGDVKEEDLTSKTVEQVFDSLDPYTTYFTQSEANSFFGTLEGSFVGIGVLSQQIFEYVTILSVYEDSPAKKAGILAGDKVVEVNGESVIGKNLNEVIAKIKGSEGTTVKVGVLRQGVKDKMTFEMRRAEVNVPSVGYEVRGDIGYILIDVFAANTDSGVAKALKFFDSKKISKVVLDLRNNPGGLVAQAVAVANRFVPKGLITKLDYKYEYTQDQTYYSTLEKTKYKLAVLVNQDSASASEILTGAIKDSKAGVVIGTKTFGKAKVQTMIPLLSQEAYERLNKDRENKSVNAYDFKDAKESDIIGWTKMTVGMYYTPNGDCIDLKGIEPNIKVAEVGQHGIFANLIEPLGLTVKPQLGTSCMDVFYAESVLSLLNYDVNTPDTTLDEKTFAAIKKFQEDNKVCSYGVLDFCTQKLLNSKLAMLKQTKDTVYAKAVELLK